MTSSSLTFQRNGDSHRRVCILANRNAGTGGVTAGRIRDLSNGLQDAGYDVGLHYSAEEFFESVQESHQTGNLRCVISAGGDGTVGLVANNVPRSVPIMVFPLGTENLLAKYISAPVGIQEAINVLEDGIATKFDLGQYTIREQGSDESATERFLVMLSCGFDADVVHRLHRERKGNINHLSWAKPIFDSILSYAYPPFQVTCWNDGAREPIAELTSHWVFVFNVPSYAGGLGICNDADPTDQFLDVCTFSGGSFWHGIYYLSAVVIGQHQNSSDFKLIRASKLRIQSESNEPVPFQVDGDPGGYLPVDIEIVPQELNLIVSKKWIQSREKKQNR